MAKIIVSLEIPLETMVNGNRQDFITSIAKEASKKYDHFNKKYGKIDIKKD